MFCLLVLFYGSCLPFISYIVPLSYSSCTAVLSDFSGEGRVDVFLLYLIYFSLIIRFVCCFALIFSSLSCVLLVTYFFFLCCFLYFILAYYMPLSLPKLLSDKILLFSAIFSLLFRFIMCPFPLVCSFAVIFFFLPFFLSTTYTVS